MLERSINGQLDSSAWIVLSSIIFIIVGGLAWCFYRAITAGQNETSEQLPDEV
ncbi:MAG: hypothetical protein JEZ07_08585 [Phycisphaerae bacterium]|nr:hypothetical protein [Phycisphaerae bacterium]